MRYIELFAGIGGFRYGLETIHGATSRGQKQQILEHDSLGSVFTGKCPKQSTFTCVWANEIDKYACQIYRKNFWGGELYEGDITKLSTTIIPDHDLLVGGFPCQAFSTAGKRQGFDDTRGTLFFEIARILRDKRPRYFLLENVKGLLSHDSGKTFQTILKVLTDLGYEYQWQVLNSKDFGVPQNRERVFIIGYTRGKCRPEVFPFPDSNGQDIRESREAKGNGQRIRRQDISAALDANYHKGVGSTRQMIKATQKLSDANRIRNTDGLSTTLKGLGGGQGAKTGLYEIESKIRRLTPIECERLQGFPDDWTEGLSDTQRYKCLGNAVTTNVITAIGKKLYEYI